MIDPTLNSNTYNNPNPNPIMNPNPNPIMNSNPNPVTNPNQNLITNLNQNLTTNPDPNLITNSNPNLITNPNPNPIMNSNSNPIMNPNQNLTTNPNLNPNSNPPLDITTLANVNQNTQTISSSDPTLNIHTDTISNTNDSNSENTAINMNLSTQSNAQNGSQANHININFSADLKQIASQNLVFIDKSDDLSKLFSVDSNRILILRPPSFGKSIICDMIENLYTGQKTLFQSLNAKIAETWDFTKKFPVIRFSMRFYATTFDEFYVRFSDVVKKLFIKFNIPMDIFSNFGIPQDALAYLIQSFTDDGQKVVLIIEDIESCLINMPFTNPHIHKIKLCMQQFFNYLTNISDSFEFLFITGIDNFFDLSNLCIDLTESPEVAGLFGITKQDIGNVDFFIITDQSELAEENFFSFYFKTIIGTFMKTLSDTFNFLKNEFINTLKYVKNSDKGFIQLKYLQHILLNCTGNCFSPSSDILVSNYIDFLGMCYHCKADYFWIQSVLRRETESISKDFAKLFQFYSNSATIYENILLNALFNDGYIITPHLDGHKYLFRFGFFSYRNNKLFPTNMNVMTLLFNATVDYIINNINIDLSPWNSLPLNEIMRSFTNFYKTTKIPLIIKANKCIETILTIYLSSIYKDSQRKILINGSLFISSQFKNFRFSEVTKLEDHISFFSNNEKNVLIYIRSFPDKNESVTFYLRVNPSLASFSVEVPKYLDSSITQSTEILGRSSIFSFTDAVLNVVFTSCWGKAEGKDKYFIASELSRKIPELCDDRYLDKKISLALQLLCQNGKLKYNVDPITKDVYYTLVKNIIPRKNLI